LGWNLLGGNLNISGAFGLFRRDYLTEILGYATSTVTEDFEVSVRLQRHIKEKALKAEATFIPDPVAWTEVPTSLKILGRQRERWHRGLIATLITHRKVLFNPRYGATGTIAMPYYLFAECLGPMVEAIGMVLTLIGTAFGLLAPAYAIAFFAVTYLYGIALSLAAILMEEASFHRYRRPADSLRLAFFAFIEPLGYRQLTVWFRLKAFWRYMRGDRSWGKMQREGFALPPADGQRLTPMAVPAVQERKTA
ncbi:MAG TPA: glycosyltransferase family 2 protein, partial [Gemmatimonadaceae bacterium]|nr:glycosyltransferase family 2 protein [Gemmatimonadaceae bacterium]